MPWRPGQRVDRALEAPYEDIPDHLRGHLRQWLQRSLGSSQELVRDIGLYWRIPLPTDHGGAMNLLMTRSDADSGFALDLVEHILEHNSVPDSHVLALGELLDMAHSAYRVKDNLTGLEMRTLPEVREQVQAVVDAADEAPAEHLAAAWNAAYGRTSDPEKAYLRSIKAVESALRPTVSPRDSTATIHKMVGMMIAAPQKWTFAIHDERPVKAAGAPQPADGVLVVIDLLKLLAYGEKQRHGQSEGPIVLNTDDEARSAVLIAVMLVQWCVSGALSRVHES